jgi:8-oxo-dGTP pyrophosphatase MutT (NUDIX family)
MQHYLQFSSDNFLLAAGGVLFRLAPSSAPEPEVNTASASRSALASTSQTDALAHPTPTQARPSNINDLQVCILRHRSTGDFVLPKGRKDVNESLEQAAMRETFEETGYACEPLPCPMFTRAPNPELYTGLKPHVEPASTEPFIVTLKMQKDGCAKLIFWYLMRVVSNSTRVDGTQMPNEDFEVEFVDAREAIEKMTKPDYKSALKLAVELVENGMTMTNHRPAFNL